MGALLSITKKECRMNHADSRFLLKNLKGIGPKRMEILAQNGISTLQQLVYFFPRRYDPVQQEGEPSQWQSGNILKASGIITQIQSYRGFRGKNVLKLMVQSARTSLSLFWFNQPFLRSRFSVNDEIHFQGKLAEKNNTWLMTHPKILSSNHSEESSAQTFIPIYPYEQDLSAGWFLPALQEALDRFECPEVFPPIFLEEKNFLPRKEALREIHFPSSREKLTQARERFAYENLLFFQFSLLFKRSSSDIGKGIKHAPSSAKGITTQMMGSLPFQLTTDQAKVWKEISRDMEDPKPMQRLLQGDVGSGKTVVAAMSLAKTIENGFQGAFMAPTEILANQHLQTLSSFFAGLPVRIELLTQSIPEKKKKEILEDLPQGKINLLIGTHALIQNKVTFSNLGLVITDEQHRFGVNQRNLLRDKGAYPDVLVMTATPIPRTLALTIYGDLDISTIRMKPHGRKEIRTFLRTNQSRDKVYSFAYDQIQQGRQVYVVVPAIEENPDFILTSIEEVHENLKKKWGTDIQMDMIHGRVSGEEKKEKMERFSAGVTQILISTTVIEVGIHVPNATVMIIENADRFGLSQLHQLRGRIGRGSFSSYCILLSDSQQNERLFALEKITDGFDLAEEDLRLRGPGEFFGSKQHGLPELNLSDYLLDISLLEDTRGVAQKILSNEQEWQPFLEEMREKFSYWITEANQH